MKKPGSQNWLLLLLTVVLPGCLPAPKLVSKEQVSFQFNSEYSSREDKQILATIKPYAEKMNKEMEEVLIISKNPIFKDQPEGPLGNLVADITLDCAQQFAFEKNSAKPEFCLLNNGGLRTALPQGPVTRGKIFELMPFENEIVLVTLSREKTEQLFTYIAQQNGMPVSGVKLGIKNNLPQTILINNKPLENRNYLVATSDYLANGGDKMDFFKNPVSITYTGIKLRDAIIGHITTKGKNGIVLKAETDGRIYHE